MQQACPQTPPPDVISLAAGAAVYLLIVPELSAAEGDSTLPVQAWGCEQLHSIVLKHATSSQILQCRCDCQYKRFKHSS
jgi:hypothetical protein